MIRNFALIHLPTARDAPGRSSVLSVSLRLPLSTYSYYSTMFSRVAAGCSESSVVRLARGGTESDDCRTRRGRALSVASALFILSRYLILGPIPSHGKGFLSARRLTAIPPSGL